jgi:hypothetical protein
MARCSRPDDEGYYYFAKLHNGWLYGPYTARSTAAGVLTQLSKYSRQPKRIYDYHSGRYIDNPNYDPYAPVGEVLKARLGTFEKAPKLSLREKYQQALVRLARIEQMLNDRGIDVEFTDEVPPFKGYEYH